MLRWIRVRNVAVIDQLEVDLEPGLNLLTGETGAGKSILIDALGLVLGSRASTEIVRTGADTAVVEAGFELSPVPEPLAARLAEAGVELDDEITIRREVSATGRGKVTVNGVAGARQLLRDMAPFLADIHGQGENWTLLRTDLGLELVDRFGGTSELVREVGEAFRSYRDAEAELARVERQASERDSRRASLRLELDELDRARLRAGEDEALLDERRLVAHAERLKSLAEDVYRALYEDEGAALSRLATVYKRIEALSEIDARWEPYLKERASVTGQLEDMSLYARDYAENIDVSPGRLDDIEGRLSQLERVKKKYGGSLEAVIERRDAGRRELEEIEGAEDRLAELTARREKAEGRYRQLASELSRMRVNAARKLEKAVGRELPGLALPKANLEIALHSDDAPERFRENGVDTVELLFSANAGEEPRPLAKTASGGELSRFMLALKAVSAKGEPPKTLVFDEVDAGIGGRVADAVGEKLLELSRVHQVVCVTHLPQIASFAPAHYRIDKMERKGRTSTDVRRLDLEGRVAEIARMLAGAEITESAREHARQLVLGKQGAREDARTPRERSEHGAPRR